MLISTLLGDHHRIAVVTSSTVVTWAVTPNPHDLLKGNSDSSF